MALPNYEGREIERYRGWIITDCGIRPKGCRFEAHPIEQDGTIPSEFSSSLDGVKELVDDYIYEHEED